MGKLMSIIQKILYTVLIMIIFLIGLNFYTPQVTYIIASYYFKDITCTIHVIGIKNLNITQPPYENPIRGTDIYIYEKGKTYDIPLCASNNGTEPMNISVKTEGDTSWGYVYFQPSNLGLLNPGDSKNTIMYFSIPVNIVSGNYTFGIRFYES